MQLPTSNRFDWLFAILAGTVINAALFMLLPRLGQTEALPPPPVITLEFSAWQPPREKPRQPEIRPKPEPKPKPKPRPRPKPVVKPRLKQARPKPIPPPERVISTREPAKPVAAPPEPVVEDVPPPTPVPADQSKAEEVSQETLPQPVPVFELTTLPRMIHRETPVYPSDMKLQGKEGTVKLEVFIDAAGKVRKITILKSAGPAFDQAAINAIQNSSFSPGNVHGKPVAVRMRLPVRFRLR